MAVCTDRHRAGEVHFCKKCDENNSTMDYINDEVSKQAGTITFLRAELEKAKSELLAQIEHIQWFDKRCDWYDDQLTQAEAALAAADDLVAEVVVDRALARNSSDESNDHSPAMRIVREYRALRDASEVNNKEGK